MRKLFAVPSFAVKPAALCGVLSLFSACAQAAPYIGAGIQALDTRVDPSLASPIIAARQLDLNKQQSELKPALFAGWQFSPHWGVELSYLEHELSDEFELVQSVSQDEEWQAELSYQQLSATLVYQQLLTNQWHYQLQAGLTYRDYQLTTAHQLDIDNSPDQLLQSSRYAEQKIGYLLTAGVLYQPLPQQYPGIQLGLAYQFSKDNLLQSHGPALTVRYQF